MSDSDILFRRLLDATDPVDLIFGQPIGPVQDATGALEIVLPAIAPSFGAKLDYDNAVSRSDVIGTGASWQIATPQASAPTRVRHAAAEPVPAARGLPWRCGARALAPRVAVWRITRPVPAGVRPRWQSARPIVPGVLTGRWAPGLRTPRGTAGSWQAGIVLSPAGAASPWQVAIIIRPTPRRIRWGAGDPSPVQIITSASLALPTHVGPVRLPWQRAIPLRPGRSTWVLPPDPEPWRCYVPPEGDAANILFDDRLGARGLDILFTCGGGSPSQLVIPVREIYIVFNSVSLVRADTGEPVPADSLTVGINRDGPHWSWSASIPGYARGLIAPDPDPIELIATLNGTAVRVLVERQQRDRRFASDMIRVGGRSRSAWLSEPNAPATARGSALVMTAQQLAADALTLNGVDIGWSIDWQVADWLVPAGAWSHYGSHMEAVQRLAEAAGGYLQAHPSAMTLRALPHYPTAPWEWASTAPDIVIPEDVAEVEGTDYIRKASYNAVFVIGQGDAGRRDRVLRMGSAGDLIAPQIIDPLATDPIMTRARGLACLSDTGPQATITLRLPVLPETGLILPGHLVAYNAEGVERRGITRSLQASWSSPELWQTIEIETHG